MYPLPRRDVACLKKLKINVNVPINGFVSKFYQCFVGLAEASASNEGSVRFGGS